LFGGNVVSKITYFVLSGRKNLISVNQLIVPTHERMARLSWPGWPAGYIPRWLSSLEMVTHASADWAQCRGTSFMETIVLPVRQTANTILCDTEYLAVSMHRKVDWWPVNLSHQHQR